MSRPAASTGATAEAASHDRRRSWRRGPRRPRPPALCGRRVDVPDGLGAEWPVAASFSLELRVHRVQHERRQLLQRPGADERKDVDLQIAPVGVEGRRLDATLGYREPAVADPSANVSRPGMTYEPVWRSSTSLARAISASFGSGNHRATSAAPASAGICADVNDDIPASRLLSVLAGVNALVDVALH